MDNEIQKFNPQDFVGKVKEKVKNVFADLIPDDKWEELITTEINAFFTESVSLEVETTRDWRNNKKYFTLKDQKVSPFRAIVWHKCIEATENAIKNELVNNYFSTIWNPTTNQFSEEFREIFENSIPKVVDNYFRCIAVQSSNTMGDIIKNTIQNGAYVNY